MRIVNSGYGFVKPSYPIAERGASAPARMSLMSNGQGARIKARRESQGLSRQGLADKVGVSRQSVIKWEESKGAVEISRARLSALARALKCSEAHILTGAPVDPPKATGGLDAELLLDCLIEVERALEGRQVSPQRRAEIVLAVYEMFAGGNPRPPSGPLLQFIRRLL